MLSFLNSLGKKSLSLPAKQENSESNGSGLSRTRTRGASDHTVTIQSFTPSTSNTDVGSLCTEEEIGLKTQERASERLRGSQPSFGSYNESVLSGTARKAARRKGVTADSRDVSGETLVDERSDVHTQSLHRDLQLFSPDWALDALPGEALRKSLEEEKRTLRRKSARISMIERATGVVRSTGSILGKRGRETIGAGIEKMQAIVGERKDKAISEQLENEYVDAPLKKRTKTSNETGLRIPSPTKSERRLARQPIVKHWLGQGLYVGQDRDFDPRLTETKNKLKRLSKQQPDAHGRRFFPLPMFAGQRTLELGRNFKLPFDIFSPLPPGQPRPEEWKKTHKSKS